MVIENNNFFQLENDPIISVCIPSRNTRPYLNERRESIELQTYKNFEVIIVDDGSSDGSREFFEEWASTDKRVCLFEGPGQGLYPGWNDAIRRARGLYVYIATSDDSMAPNFLKEMVLALELNPECGIAHCPLKIFSDSFPEGDQSWWATASPFALSLNGDVTYPHKRMAPGDGLLHGCGTSVYVSTTQLLIRRNVFDEVGYFTDRWGSIGDFDWAMRASLVTNTIHVPSTWGGWRLHAAQATALANLDKDAQTTKNLQIFSSLIKEHLLSMDSAEVTKFVIHSQIEIAWEYVRLKAQLKCLIGRVHLVKLANFCFRHPNILCSALAAKLGIKSRWHWESERVIIDFLLKSFNWIKPC